jgi:O-antigen/teichoic acid export membrane protein
MKSIFVIAWGQSGADEASPPLAVPAAESVLHDATGPMIWPGVFSVLDQAIVSGANFLTTLILARTCAQEELGVYSLAWTVVLFLAAVQGNLITVPYTMYCHRHSGEALADYAGSTLAHQLMTSLAAMLCFLGLAVVLALGFGPAQLQPAVWVLLGVIPFVLLREYARRFTLAHLALGIAITIDGVVALLQIGTLLVLRQFDLLSAAAVYASFGAACAVASVCWWLLDAQPMRFSGVRFAADWWRNWSFGRWAMLSQLTGLAFYALPWILTAVHGVAPAGELAACGTLVGLSNLFVMGLNNFLMPKAARAFSHQGSLGLSRVLRKATLASVVVLGSLCVAMFFAGGWVAGVVFGGEYADTGSLIALLSLATFADALGLTASTGLWAMDRPAANLIGDLLQLFVTLGTALWLVYSMSTMGIAIALVVGRTTGAGVRWLTLGILLALATCEPESA